MYGVTRTIAVVNDFLRDEPNGLDNHVMNREWLAAITRTLCGPVFAVRQHGFDCGQDHRIDIAQCMSALGLTCGPEAWAAAWDLEPSEEFVGLLRRQLTGTHFVAGFGLSNVIARAIDRLGLPFVDLEISPLRFCEELEVDARTNVKALADADIFRPPRDPLFAGAAAIIGWTARHVRDMIPADAGEVGVIFGQTEVDASLIDRGGIADFRQYRQEIRQWAQGLDHVLFRPHPYARGNEAFEHLSGIVPTIRPTLMNSYQLLASGRISRVLALSSSIIDEAEYFRVKGARLAIPKRRVGDFHYTTLSNLNILRPEVISAIVNGDLMPCLERQNYLLRKQFGMNWGLPLAVAESDFYAPPTLTSRCAPQADTGGDTPREAPAVESSAAERQSIGVLRKIRREGNRIIGQLARLLHTVAGTSVAGATGKLPHAKYAAAPTHDSSQEISSHASQVPPAKDFSYGSGERQTAMYYYQIRRDHRARYELAERILPKGIRVLDLFCGNGYGSFLLSDGRDVVGVDGSTDAIAVATRHYAGFGAKFETRCFPFEDATEYDAVVSYESIEHVQEDGEYFRFLVARVKPGGLLLYSTPNADRLRFDPDVQIHHFRHYSLEETLDFARAEDLAVLTWFGQDVYHLEDAAIVGCLPSSQMELNEHQPGQFTVVVARKPH